MFSKADSLMLTRLDAAETKAREEYMRGQIDAPTWICDTGRIGSTADPYATYLSGVAML